MARPKSGVTPCTACNYPTRTTRSSIQEYPGTRQRVHGMCRRCFEIKVPRQRDSPRENAARARSAQEIENNPPDPVVVAGLDRFVQARNARLARWRRLNR